MTASAADRVDSPQVSVLLPVRDAEPWLAWTLADLSAQQRVSFEVLAVDDGSQDNSRAQLEQWARRDRRFRVFEGHGRGAAAALNLALEQASAPFIAHMEADDRCVPVRLVALKQALEALPEGHAVCSQAGLLGPASDGMRSYVNWQNRLLDAGQHRRGRFVEIPALHQTGMYHAAFLRRLGGYRDDPRWPLDIDFWMRFFAEGGEVMKLPEIFYLWRQHERQSTRTSPRHRQTALRHCKAHFFVNGPGHQRPIEILSVGESLVRWQEALHQAGARDVIVTPWQRGLPTPKRAAGAVRLCVFGKQRARQRVLDSLPDYERELDWFAG